MEQRTAQGWEAVLNLISDENLVKDKNTDPRAVQADPDPVETPEAALGDDVRRAERLSRAAV